MDFGFWRRLLLIGDLFIGKKEKEVKKQTPTVSQKNKAQGKLCDYLNVLVLRSIMAGFDVWMVK